MERDGRDRLKDYAQFNALIDKPSYSAANRKALLDILTRNGLTQSGESADFILRENRGRLLFSRDCAAYCLATPGGARLWTFVNHLKSKGYGTPKASNLRRKLQAQRVREIYDPLVATNPLIAVVGDLNDTPNSDPLAPLVANGSTLKDVSAHPAFDDGGRPETCGNCAAGNTIDFLLRSPALYARPCGGGIWRMGCGAVRTVPRSRITTPLPTKCMGHATFVL